MTYSSPERNRRVLVIDDNRAIHNDFRKILNADAVENGSLTQAEAVLFEKQAHAQRPMHFQIDSAYQGQEGLARVQMAIQARCPYAVAFVDVRMPPGWDGVETIQRIWEVDPDLQVVVCTAYSDYSWDEMINKVGNSDRMLILKKPFDIVEVLQLANALTEKWWLQQQVKCQVDELELTVTERTKKLQEANKMLRVEVAERKQAEEALREAEERFRIAAETSNDMVYEWDLKQSLHWFGKVDEMLGYGPGEFPRTLDGWAESVHPEDMERVMAAIQAHLERRVPYAEEYRVRMKDGVYRWWSAHGAVARTPEGKTIRWVGTVTDITERKQAAESLQIKTEQLQAITDAMVAFLQSGGEHVPSSILLHNALKQTGSECGFVAVVMDGPALRILAHAGIGWDKTVHQGLSGDAADGDKENGRLEFTNFKNLFGSVITSGQSVISNEPGADSRSGEGLPPETLPLRRFLGVPILSGTQVVGMICVANRPDGYTGEQQNKIEILTRAAGILFDSYQHQQREDVLEQQLRQAQKVEAIGRLAGGVAHDFNNILTAILGYSELMLMRIKPDDSLRGNVQEIRKAAERAAALTRQLLAFSRKQILEPKVVDLNDILKDLSTMLRRMIGEDVELTTLGAPDLGLVKVDPSQIEQVIINLAINARDAMPQGGKLTIEIANVVLDNTYAAEHEDVAPGKHVVLTVSDTGIGMSAKVRARLFEPFFTTKEEGKGTGLGLATCYGIVKQSGGHISVDSEPGHGTTFTVYLPQLEEAAAVQPKLDESTDLPHGKETVLLVEDEPSLLKLASLILQELGYTVLEASNGREALRIAEERNGQGVDLVLTDVVMPQMGGKELVDHIHAAHPGTRVLFSSGYTENTVVHHGVLDDGIAFLPKPYTRDTLARKVREVLDRPKPGDAASTAAPASG